MEADPSRLRALLEELHAELSRNPPADDHSRALVRGLREDISRYESAENAQADEAQTLPMPHSLRGRLQEMVVAMEGSHPQLAATVEQTMVALSNMGL